MDAGRRLSSPYLAGPGDARAAARIARMAALIGLLSLVPACATLPEGETLVIDYGGPAPSEAMAIGAEGAAAASLDEGPSTSASSLPADDATRSITERPYWPQAQAPGPLARRRAAPALGPSSGVARGLAHPGASAERASSAASRDPAEPHRGSPPPAAPPTTPSVGSPSGRVFAYEADRVYEVVTAPLRVTVVTLAPGETVVSRASGDTLRWQIGETRSGSDATERVHVLLKPLERGLATNLVLATSGRLYLLALRSGAPDAFDQTVSWTYAPELSADEPMPPRPMDGRYRITPQGRAPRWTPLAVLTDGARTEIIFPGDLASGEAPVLIGRQADGSPRLLTYRQAGNRYLVDEVIEDGELRLGGRQPRVVRIRRLTGAPR